MDNSWTILRETRRNSGPHERPSRAKNGPGGTPSRGLWSRRSRVRIPSLTLQKSCRWRFELSVAAGDERRRDHADQTLEVPRVAGACGRLIGRRYAAPSSSRSPTQDAGDGDAGSALTQVP